MTPTDIVGTVTETPGPIFNEASGSNTVAESASRPRGVQTTSRCYYHATSEFHNNSKQGPHTVDQKLCSLLLDPVRRAAKDKVRWDRTTFPPIVYFVLLTQWQ